MADITIDEATKILAGEDPRSEKFYANSDPQLVTQVNRAFERAHPGELDTGNGSTSLNEAMAATLNDVPPIYQVEPDNSAEVARLRDDLKHTWGESYETHFEQAREVFNSLPPDDIAGLTADYAGLGEDSLVVDYMARPADWKRAEIERRYPGIQHDPRIQALLRSLEGR